MKATQFLKTIAHLVGAQRDRRIVAAAKTDLVQWEWVEVPLDNGRGHFRAAKDYVAIGEHADWVRVPMGGHAAQEIADITKSVLPSPYMVELIHRASVLKLNPIMLGTNKMMSTARFAEHNAKIEALRTGRDGLVSGIKKDIVVSNKLERKPNSVCIFGWYRPNGSPIQTVSTKHEITYSDYSHGVRLVHPEMMLDGRVVSVQEVMRDARNALVLTGGTAWGARHDAHDDSVLRVVRYGMQPAYTIVSWVQETPTKNAPQKTETLGDRCVRWCLNEMVNGVKEEPKGSKTSPRIAEYFAPARRRGTEKLLKIKAADWCAVAQCAALAANTRTGEDVPHGYRAAVRELREDAQATGAWVPIADIRSKRYSLWRGDLLVKRRGTAGLGHVVRVEEAHDSFAIVLGANEDDQWKRSKMSFDDKDLEGAISYHRFNPGLQLQPFDSPKSPPQRATEPSTAPDEAAVDRWARGVVLRAWSALFPGKPITAPELQALMCIGRYERFYGLAKKPVAGIGANNWGGVQCRKGQCDPAKCYKGGDIDSHGKAYPICFRKYATPEAGAADMITQVTTRRPDVWDALKTGNLSVIAERMAVGRTVNGKWVGVYHETPPQKYANGLLVHARIISTNLGESLAVRLAENVPANERTVIQLPYTQHTPAQSRLTGQHTQAYATQSRSGRQNGIRALVASRRPHLASVIVGASSKMAEAELLEQRLDALGAEIAALNEDCDSADAAYARAIRTSTSGVTTSTQVVDHANRVNDYVRALHQIVTDARRNTTGNDAFPWTEWAAFRASWDVVYFDITHSLLVNFDDSVVTEYETQSRQWEIVIAKHYGKRPAVRPVLDESSTTLKIALGVAAGFGLLYAVSRGVS